MPVHVWNHFCENFLHIFKTKQNQRLSFVKRVFLRRCEFCFFFLVSIKSKLIRIHQVLLQLPEILVKLVCNSICWSHLLELFCFFSDLYSFCGWYSVMKSWIMANGENLGQSKLKLSSDKVILSLWDSFQQIIDHRQHSILIIKIKLLQRTNFLGNGWQNEFQVIYAQAFKDIIYNSNQERLFNNWPFVRTLILTAAHITN